MQNGPRAPRLAPKRHDAQSLCNLAHCCAASPSSMPGGKQILAAKARSHLVDVLARKLVGHCRLLVLGRQAVCAVAQQLRDASSVRLGVGARAEAQDGLVQAFWGGGRRGPAMQGQGRRLSRAREECQQAWWAATADDDTRDRQAPYTPPSPPSAPCPPTTTPTCRACVRLHTKAPVQQCSGIVPTRAVLPRGGALPLAQGAGCGSPYFREAVLKSCSS